MKFYFILSFFFLSLSLSAQLGEEYSIFVREAEKLYQEKQFKQSADAYQNAFSAAAGKGYMPDRYNAACSHALAAESDSAFAQLWKIATKGNYQNIDHMLQDTDLNSLHQYSDWEKICAAVRKNKEAAEANLNRPLAAFLDSIHNEDQKYRQKIKEVREVHGWDSPHMQDLWKTIAEKDSLNVIAVSKVLDEHGWLGSDVVGQKGNSCLFLVIQHAPLATQLKYLPRMREAVEKGNAQAGSLALLEDRTALRQGKRQIYGSQVGTDPETKEMYVLPLEDPDNVDKRRASVGLQPLANYISNWNLTWDVEAYKKQLPEIEQKGS